MQYDTQLRAQVLQMLTEHGFIVEAADWERGRIVVLLPVVES